jgi:hypothetical protein
LVTVYLVPIGRDRFELYSESADSSSDESGRHAGFFARQMAALRRQWDRLSESARHARQDGSSGWMTRVRDLVVRKLAETIAEQRALWALRGETAATLVFPVSRSEAAARMILHASLARARRHHLTWLIVDGLIFVASGLIAIIPGPNLLAYYFAFRALGHGLSWRGAGHALGHVQWTLVSSEPLSALEALAHVATGRRRGQVDQIAARLGLARFAGFFDRVARPSGKPV